MREHPCLLTGLLYLLAAAPLAGQQDLRPQFTITGIVVNAQDNSPLAHCRVTASLVSPDTRAPFREPLRGETDERGRFLLAVPSAGNWQLQAAAHHVRSQSLNEHQGYFSGVILTAAHPVYNVIFRAVPDAQLSGTVSDEEGEPVRNAMIAVFGVSAPTSDQPHMLQQRNGTQTDDRGRYEFASLEPGSYLVQVQARPWYASAPNHLRQPGTSALKSPQPDTALDPSLDLVYPVTWYPGVSETAAASSLVARPGDRLRADFRLFPQASSHVSIRSRDLDPAFSGQDKDSANGQNLASRSVPVPSVALVLPDGTTQPVYAQFTPGAGGGLEIGGLAPGTYRIAVRGSGPDSPARTSVVQIYSASSAIELASPQPLTSLSVAIDGTARVSAGAIQLRSTTTGEIYSARSQDRGLRGFGDQRASSGKRPPSPSGGERPTPRVRSSDQGGQARPREHQGTDEVTLRLPADTYQVELNGGSSAYITGITAAGAPVLGRTVTIGEAPTHLAIHLGSGFAAVSGFATYEAIPEVGALALLVPAAFGNPGSLTTVKRDETNTDGSFRFEDVTPGQYILVVLHDGWSRDWSLPHAMQAYLLHGIPLDLKAGANISRQVVATLP